RGYSTRYIYDEINRLVRIENAKGGKTLLSYDSVGNLLKSIDPNGNPVTLEYNALNRVTAKRDGLGNTTKYSYTPTNKIKELIDPNGGKTQYEYNRMDRLVSVLDALGGRTGYAYDVVGNLAAVTDANGNKTEYAYDPLNRLIQEINPLGYKTQYQYDRLGRIVKVATAKGGNIEYRYDPVGNLIQKQLPNGNLINFAYDEIGNIISSQTQSFKEEFRYDLLGRPIERNIAAWNKTTRYSYDPAGNLAQLTDPLGKAIRYRYDELGNLSELIDPEGKKSAFAYDAAGRPVKKTYANDVTTEYKWDAADRLTSLVTESRRFGRINGYFYEYDKNGNRARTLETDGALTLYQYDPLNRLTKASYAYESIWNIRNACLVPPCPQWPVKAQDKGLGPQNQNLSNKPDTSPQGKGKSDTSGKGPGNGKGNAYQNNQGNGNSNGNGRKEGFDQPISPVLEDPVREERWTYDNVGNRIRHENDFGVTDYTYDRANRISSARGIQNISFEYDENGNLIKETGYSGITSYRYDTEGKLTEVILPDATGVKYQYDGFGRRTITQETYWQNKNQLFTEETKTLYYGMGYLPETLGQMGIINPRKPRITSGSSMLASLAGQDVLMEFTKQNNPLNEYIYANGDLISKRMWGFKGRKEPGADGSVRRRGNNLFFHTDALGDVVDISDQLGQNIIKNRYLSFGAQFAPYGRFGFTGMALEENIGKYYAGSRFYDYRTGRFQTSDIHKGSLAAPATLNLYQYAANNPINYIDPLGYSKLSKAWKKVEKWYKKKEPKKIREFATKYKTQLLGYNVIVGVILELGGLAPPVLFPLIVNATAFATEMIDFGYLMPAALAGGKIGTEVFSQAEKHGLLPSFYVKMPGGGIRAGSDKNSIFYMVVAINIGSFGDKMQIGWTHIATMDSDQHLHGLKGRGIKEMRLIMMRLKIMNTAIWALRGDRDRDII
ncbi:MAG: RHS repeat protein, partial [Deltaproteobacteria bacterium]|nr:RHS repeat protein [Deltaproteobacteria bacterium]